ncbi:MAG: hypothetical protein ACRDK5_00585 [Solirubrobacterales bacterium]
MESTVSRSGIDLARQPARPGLALALALLSVPGSTIAWDLFDGAGFVIGLPLAVAAIVLGVQARQRSSEGRRRATAAIVIAGLMLVQMAVITVVGVL